MEKLNLIINDVICNIGTFDIKANSLDRYFLLLDEYKDINLIDIENDKCHEFWGKFLSAYNLPQNYNAMYSDMLSNEIGIFKQIFLSIINVDSGNKIKTIPLLLKFDLNGILTRYLLEVDFFSELSEQIFELIKCIQLKLNINENMSSLHYEHVLFSEYQKSQLIETMSFLKINEFVESLERSGKLNFNIQIFNLFCPVLYTLNKDLLLSIFNSHLDFTQYLGLTNSLDFASKIDIALCSENVLVKFAVIWHVNNYPNNTKDLYLSQNEINSLTDLVIQFSEDNHTWNELITYVFKKVTMYKNMQDIMSAIGSACHRLDPEKMINFFEQLPISNSLDSDNIINHITYFVNSIGDEQKQVLAYNVLYKRWEAYIDAYPNYCVSLLLTNFVNVVINSISTMQQLQDIEAKINLLTQSIELSDNIWFKNSTAQTTFIYKKLSKLFVYCVALKNLNPNIDFTKVDELISNIKFLENETSINNNNNNKTTLIMFDEYIIKT